MSSVLFSPSFGSKNTIYFSMDYLSKANRGMSEYLKKNPKMKLDIIDCNNFFSTIRPALIDDKGTRYFRCTRNAGESLEESVFSYVLEKMMKSE